MSTLALAAALAAAPALPSCSWDHPGHNPFVGDVVAAVDRYQDIPPEVRARLKERMARRAYDEVAEIRRDAIVGRATYAPEIRDMHFGRGQVCGTITRAQWSPTAVERGLVYCEAEHCIIVPTVCRNVSRITRLSTGQRSTTAAATPPGAGGQNAEPLELEAPAAGPPSTTFADRSAPGDGITPLSAPGPVPATPVTVAGGPPPGSAEPPIVPLAYVPPVRDTLPPPSVLPPLPPVVPPAIPEPGTWALLLGGLAVVGWQLRRRRVQP